MREDGKHKTRDSQRWKRVQVQARRRYGEQERPSKYLEKTNIGAGNLDDEGWGRDDTKEGVDEGRQEQGQASEGTESEGEGSGRHKVNEAMGAGRRGGHYYLLADPRLAEAHNYSTVVPHTGAIVPHHRPSQNLTFHNPST